MNQAKVMDESSENDPGRGDFGDATRETLLKQLDQSDPVTKVVGLNSGNARVSEAVSYESQIFSQIRQHRFGEHGHVAFSAGVSRTRRARATSAVAPVVRAKDVDRDLSTRRG